MENTTSRSKSASERLEDFSDGENDKTALRRALRRINDLKKQKTEVVTAVYQAARDGLEALELAPVIPPSLDAREHGAEVAVAMLGDLQLGKVTPTYNSQVCEERVEKYADKILLLTDIQRADHPVRELHVWMLGDMVEGENLIFPSQPWQIDATLYDQVTVTGPRVICNFLRKMLSIFEKVHVTAIIGNHGAVGRRGDYNPETNMDRFLYNISRQILHSENRLTWTIPAGAGERNWYAIDRIGNYSCLLFHGDQFGGRLQGSLTRTGIQRKVGGWKAGAVPDPFKDVAFGHWHVNYEDTISSCTVRGNGSTESTNLYAQEVVASMCRPSQRLMFVHPELGHPTAEYKVWLD
jgi:hypothetical protein